MEGDDDITEEGLDELAQEFFGEILMIVMVMK